MEFFFGSSKRYSINRVSIEYQYVMMEEEYEEDFEQGKKQNKKKCKDKKKTFANLWFLLLEIYYLK